MRLQLFYMDVRHILSSKRTSYTLLIMAVFAIAFALVMRFAPEGLKAAMEAANPTSAGVFEFAWFEDVLKFLLLVVVSFGAFVISDLEDDGTLALNLARPETRSVFLTRRILASLTSFFVVFMVGTVIVGAIAVAIVGDLDFSLFILHQLMLMPMLVFVIALTFFISVPLRNTTYTVLASFAISLIMSFTYTFQLMAGASEVSIYNPMAFGYRILTDAPLANALYVILASAALLFIAGGVWFHKKDI